MNTQSIGNYILVFQILSSGGSGLEINTVFLALAVINYQN